MGCSPSSDNGPVQKDPIQVDKPADVRREEISITNADFTEHDIKILTLGSGECGKTTLWRQLKRIYCGGFKPNERKTFIDTMRINIIDDIKKLIQAARRNNQNFANALQRDIDMIDDLNLVGDDLNSDAANAILRVWQDPIMKVVYEQSNSIGIGENASYFLDSVQRIASEGYSPTDEDILKARIRTNGKNEFKFKIDDKKTLLIDVGGQKGERRNWQSYFEGVDYAMFVISLSDFDQHMFEDLEMRRTQDSLDLFMSIATSPIFADKNIFLILNKYDLFKKKIHKSPEAFREVYNFNGNIEDEGACLEHVKQHFLNALEPGTRSENTWIIPIQACAMEEESIREIFQVIGKKIKDKNTQ